MATLIFNKAKILGQAAEGAQRGINKAAMALVRDIRKALNKSGYSGDTYTPSKEGEYPHKKTGNLRKSVDWWEDTDNIAAEVGVNVDAPYWSDLEFGTIKMGPRPFVRPRVRAMRDELEQIVGVEVKISLGT